jgi:hypothetical protein
MTQGVEAKDGGTTLVAGHGGLWRREQSEMVLRCEGEDKASEAEMEEREEESRFASMPMVVDNDSICWRTQARKTAAA